MYAAIIFAAFITSSATAAVKLSEGREFGVGTGFRFQIVADQELQQVVTSAVATIDRIAKSPWKAEQKLTAIHDTFRKVKVYRANSWSRSPATEMELDMLIGPYESFPVANNFKKQHCQNYYSTLKNEWEPTAKNAPTLNGVSRAWNNLKAICEG